MKTRRTENVLIVGKLTLWVLTLSLCVIEVTATKGCYETLGVTTGDIGQQDITASKKFKNFTSGMDAWCSPVTDENQFIQFDLGEKTKVTRIATQGDPASGGRFVKSYALLYSNNGKSFDVYSEDAKKEKVFEGNVDAYSVKHSNLKKPLVTRYLRINPRSWEQGICLRTELYGCDGQTILQMTFDPNSLSVTNGARQQKMSVLPWYKRSAKYSSQSLLHRTQRHELGVCIVQIDNIKSPHKFN